MTSSPANLFERLARPARERPDAVALEVASGATRDAWSYRRLFEEAERVAANLAARGVARGDRVAFYAAPSADFVVGVLAALRAGAMLVPINTAYWWREIGHILEDASPRLLLDGESEGTAFDEIPDSELGGVRKMPLQEL